MAQPTGRLIERFTPFERSAHMVNATAFSILAISGLVMAFGKFFLLPIIGTDMFGWLAYVLKNAHNFAGPLFAVSLVVVIVTFVRDNLPAKGDLNWLLKGGGMFAEHEVKSGRFNAGEKVVFWAGVFVLGLVVVGSGLVMDKLLPGLVYERGTMQVAHMVHSVSNILMVVLFMGHIYLGTIGTEGAFQGMRTGYVDETWAREHHELWYDDVKAGRVPAQRSPAAVPRCRTFHCSNLKKREASMKSIFVWVVAMALAGSALAKLPHPVTRPRPRQQRQPPRLHMRARWMPTSCARRRTGLRHAATRRPNRPARTQGRGTGVRLCRPWRICVHAARGACGIRQRAGCQRCQPQPPTSPRNSHSLAGSTPVEWPSPPCDILFAAYFAHASIQLPYLTQAQAPLTREVMVSQRMG